MTARAEQTAAAISQATTALQSGIGIPDALLARVGYFDAAALQAGAVVAAAAAAVAVAAGAGDGAGVGMDGMQLVPHGYDFGHGHQLPQYHGQYDQQYNQHGQYNMETQQYNHHEGTEHQGQAYSGQHVQYGGDAAGGAGMGGLGGAGGSGTLQAQLQPAQALGPQGSGRVDHHGDLRGLPSGQQDHSGHQLGLQQHGSMQQQQQQQQQGALLQHAHASGNLQGGGHMQGLGPAAGDGTAGAGGTGVGAGEGAGLGDQGGSSFLDLLRGRAMEEGQNGTG